MSSLYKNSYKPDFNLFPLDSTFLQIVSKTTAYSHVNRVLISAYTLKDLSLLGSHFYIQTKLSDTDCMLEVIKRRQG